MAGKPDAAAAAQNKVVALLRFVIYLGHKVPQRATYVEYSNQLEDSVTPLVPYK